MEEKTMAGTAGLIYLLTWIPSEGFATKVLWAWFAVPLGAPPITVLMGAGLGLLLGHSVLSANYRKRTDEGNFGQAVQGIVRPWIFLTFGFIVHVLMVGI